MLISMMCMGTDHVLLFKAKFESNVSDIGYCGMGVR